MNQEEITNKIEQLKGERTALIDNAITEAYTSGRLYERAIISQAVANIFYSVLRHPAHAQSDIENILKSVATAIRTGAHAISLEEDDE
jgi:hypothetical protein